ncbi:hypothetical protein ACH41E_18560 [Streptomyces sp. NPDC020412]
MADKVTTLFGRAAPRDYLDVNAALASGRYSGGQLKAAQLKAARSDIV